MRGTLSAAACGRMHCHRTPCSVAWPGCPAGASIFACPRPARRGLHAEDFNYCTVPQQGTDAFLFASLALLAGACALGKLAMVWVLLAGRRRGRRAACRRSWQALSWARGPAGLRAAHCGGTSAAR